MAPTTHVARGDRRDGGRVRSGGRRRIGELPRRLNVLSAARVMVVPAPGAPGEAGPERRCRDGRDGDDGDDHSCDSKFQAAPSEQLASQLFD